MSQQNQLNNLTDITNVYKDQKLNSIKLSKFVQAFNANTEAWKYYYQHFLLQIGVHGLQNNTNSQHTLFLKWIGAEHYKINFDNFDPKPILTVHFNDIIYFQTSFYKSKTSYQTERLKFGEINKTLEQSISLFINFIRANATECRLKDTLDKWFRDQFLLRLDDPRMQEQLIRAHPEDDIKLLTL